MTTKSYPVYQAISGIKLQWKNEAKNYKSPNKKNSQKIPVWVLYKAIISILNVWTFSDKIRVSNIAEIATKLKN